MIHIQASGYALVATILLDIHEITFEVFMFRERCKDVVTGGILLLLGVAIVLIVAR